MIRPVKQEDLDSCEKLVSQPETIAFNGEFVTKDWLSVLSDDKLSFVLIDEEQIYDEDKIIGCIFGEKLKMNGCLLWLIAIVPEYKNRGYGSMLLKHLERVCIEEHSIEWMILYSTTNSEMNHHFYTKHGFVNKSGTFYEFGKELSR